MSVEAVAKELDISSPTIYRMIGSGELAALKHGGRSWIARDEIEDYFARQGAEAAKRRAARSKATRETRRGRTSR